MKQFKIKTNINERNFIELLLNMHYSKCKRDYLRLLLSLYALKNSWHIDKLYYYLSLIEVEE